MPTDVALDLSHLDDMRLIDAETGLRKMFEDRLAVSYDTADVEALHARVAKEMRSRAMVYEPLAIVKAKFTEPVEPEPVVVEKSIMQTAFDAYYDEIIEKSLTPHDDAARGQMAEQGIALPDGSFPIPDEAHLHAAVRLFGQAQDPQAAMNHIIERAKAMGLESALPPEWNVQSDDADAAPGVNPGAHATPGPVNPDPNAGKPSATRPATQPKPGAPAPGAGGAPVPPGQTQRPQPPKPGLMKRIAEAVTKAMGGDVFNEDEFVKALEVNLDPDFEYAVIKAVGEDQFTLGPMYVPDKYDAHDEWATAEDMQKSLWDYVRETGDSRDVYLQHRDIPAGEWVEAVSWPYEVHATMKKSVDGVMKSEETVFPAGTPFLGVVWNDWAWADVKKGKIQGFSMGGNARRIEAEID